MKGEIVEILHEGVTDLAYLVEAATDDRYGRPWSDDVAVRLLNQVGNLVGKKLTDLGELLAVVEEKNLTVAQILEVYNLGGEALEIVEDDVRRLLAIGKEHCLTVEERRKMDSGIVLQLDHTIKLSFYRAAYSLTMVSELQRFTDDGEAFWIAFLSPLEAYFKIRLNEHNHCSYEQVEVLIKWCREAVGLPVDYWKGEGDQQKPPQIAGVLQI